MPIKLNHDLGSTLVDNETLEDLIDSHLKLIALEQAGVDNWDGYDFALDYYADAMDEYKKGNIN